jgi:endoglucanase
MLRYLILCAALFLTVASQAAEIYFQDSFDAGKAPGWAGESALEQAPDRGQVLHLSQSAPADKRSATMTIALPVEKMRGSFVFFGADVRAKAVSAKPQSWNGIKVMLIVETPGGKDYPQAALGVGDIDWTRAFATTPIPNDAISATLVLGLEQVSGDVWFDNIRVSLRKKIAQAPAADPAKPIFRGHDLPRLRGAMVPNTLPQADFIEFADRWNSNLVRWQLIQVGQKKPSVNSFDTWLEGELVKFDQVLTWAEDHHMKVVLDLHSPPGGESSEGGYVAATGRIFSDPAAQQKFIECWQKMAQRYKGRQAIWGFDLMNEPIDSSVAEGCDDWQDLVARAAKAVHAIDPQRTLIVEPTPGGDPSGFTGFQPLDEPNVVYSFHMYVPHAITHQGVFGPSAPMSYPGTVEGKQWNKAAIEATMKPALDFANRYRVHMYVGEFSCIRTAPGDTRLNYLTDVIDLFEKHNWDWSYHAFREWPGWSVEHTGPLSQPVLEKSPSSAQSLLRNWYAKNKKR